MFSLFKRKELELTPAAVRRLLGAAQVRHRLDTIYEKCGIPRGEGSIERELARLAAFSAALVSDNIGVSVGKQVNGAEALAIATISIVCADHLSRAAGKDFHGIAAEAIMFLPLVDDPTELSLLHGKACATYAALVDSSSKALFGIGQAFANFFTTADQEALSSAAPHAARLLDITRSALSDGLTSDG